MAGFYRSRYKPTAAPASASVPRDDEYHYMFSTQVESCDARQAFPCFDEPNLKASFEFEIEIPEDQTALSNMPETGSKPSKDGWKVVSFEKSPIMSTYLYAWAFGDFEYVEDFTRRKYNGKSLPVRVYTTKGLKEQGQLALSTCHQIVDYFSEVRLMDTICGVETNDPDLPYRLPSAQGRFVGLPRIRNYKYLPILKMLLT